MTFGSWFSKLLGKGKVYIRTYEGWYEEVKAWELRKAPGADLAKGIPAESPIISVGVDNIGKIKNYVKNVLSMEFVTWINSSGTVDKALKADIEASIVANKANIYAGLVHEMLIAIANDKRCEDKVYSLPHFEPSRGGDDVVEAIIKAAFQWPWARVKKVHPVVDQSISNSFQLAMKSSRPTITKIVCDSLRIDEDGPDLIEIQDAIKPAMFSNIGGAPIASIIGIARNLVNGMYNGGYDCVAGVGTPKPKVASVPDDERELRSSLIRLAHEKKHLRPHLLPLIQEPK